MNKERVNLTVDAWIMNEARRAAETYDVTLSRLVSEGLAMRVAQLDAATHHRQLDAAGLNDPDRAETEQRALADDAAHVHAPERGAA